MAQYAELNIDQGTDYQAIININESDNPGTGINLASYNAASYIRKSFYSRGPIAEFNCAISYSTTIPASNIALNLTSAQTSNITPGQYVFDVKITDGNNLSMRVMEGIITINPAVTY